MPTGYTYGIIEGKVKTFKEFAENCMRNFGACIHMRDDDSDKKYTPRIPSDYHSKKLKEASIKLKKNAELSDKEIIKQEKKKLNDDKKHYLEEIEKTKKTAAILESFLSKAKSYKAPTKEHEGIRDFMIQQLESTIDHDGDHSYYTEQLQEIKTNIYSINADVIRCEAIKNINDDMNYHLKHHKEEIKRCADSNKWVEVFIESLK